MTIAALHRGVFWEFPFRGIYYCHSNKSTGKKTVKTHRCALQTQSITGISLCSNSHREFPVSNEYMVPAMRTGVPCNENRLFPVRIYYTGKTLFWPCTGPVLDYSECTNRGYLIFGLGQWMTLQLLKNKCKVLVVCTTYLFKVVIFNC